MACMRREKNGEMDSNVKKRNNKCWLVDMSCHEVKWKQTQSKNADKNSISTQSLVVSTDLSTRS